MSKITDPRELFVHELGDILYAEKVLVKALPKLATEATDAELRSGFEAHLAETRQHVANVEQVFTALGEKAKAEKCPGIDGIKAEHDEFMRDNKPTPAGLRPVPDRRGCPRRALRDRRLHRPRRNGRGTWRARSGSAPAAEPQAGTGCPRRSRENVEAAPGSPRGCRLTRIRPQRGRSEPTNRAPREKYRLGAGHTGRPRMCVALMLVDGGSARAVANHRPL